MKVQWIGCLTLLVASACHAQQIMPQQTVAAIRASLPMLEDEEANALLHSDELVWYDSQSMLPVYQHQNGNGVGRSTAHYVGYNISADPSDSGFPHGQGGNGGVEFPWRMGRPGGAHNAAGVRSVKAFYFPKAAAVFERTVPGRVGTGNRAVIWDWVFAEGTVFVELIMQRIGQEDVPFEIRTRTKEGDEWAVDIYRPFATAEQLAEALEELGPGKLRAEAIKHLRSTGRTTYQRLADDTHTRKRAFEMNAYVYNLPRIVTADLLKVTDDRKWVSCLGETFYDEAVAPSNESEYVNLVPPGYHGAFVGSDRVDCMNCHESSGKHVTTFQDRGWYGLVPGGFTEKILSWHPFDRSCISMNGSNRQKILNRQFVRDGLVVFVQRQLPAGYQMTKVD